MSIRPSTFLALFAAVFLATLPGTGTAASPLLTLSPAPPRDGARPGGPPGPLLESEHRPSPMRVYLLKGGTPGAPLLAEVLRPTGAVDEAVVERRGATATVSFATPMGDGPLHGVHNLYVIQEGGGGGEIQVAKWITVHHNCGWGHPYKFDQERLRPRSLETVPLEIVPQGLWDGNFHSDVRSGDTLTFRVLSYGDPAGGARIQLTTAEGWTKEVVADAEGTASLQLASDYFPGEWGEFHSAHRAPFVVAAEWEKPSSGTEGPARLTTTVSWRYFPPRRAYTSRLAGLSFGAAGLALSGMAVLWYRTRRHSPLRGGWNRD